MTSWGSETSEIYDTVNPSCDWRLIWFEQQNPHDRGWDWCLNARGTTKYSAGNLKSLYAEAGSLRLILNCLLNFEIGFIKSWMNEKSLWLMSSAKNRLQGPPHFCYSSRLCWNGINLSLIPWTMNVGHLTLAILSMFLNLSWINRLNHLLVWKEAILRMEVNGDIRYKALGLRLLARWVAGPVPMLLPNTITLLSSNPSTWVI